MFKRSEDPRPRLYLAKVVRRDPERPVSAKEFKVSVRSDKRSISRKFHFSAGACGDVLRGSGAPLPRGRRGAAAPRWAPVTLCSGEAALRMCAEALTEPGLTSLEGSARPPGMDSGKSSGRESHEAEEEGNHGAYGSWQRHGRPAGFSISLYCVRFTEAHDTHPSQKETLQRQVRKRVWLSEQPMSRRQPLWTARPVGKKRRGKGGRLPPKMPMARTPSSKM